METVGWFRRKRFENVKTVDGMVLNVEEVSTLQSSIRKLSKSRSYDKKHDEHTF